MWRWRSSTTGCTIRSYSYQRMSNSELGDQDLFSVLEGNIFSGEEELQKEKEKLQNEISLKNKTIIELGERVTKTVVENMNIKLEQAKSEREKTELRDEIQKQKLENEELKIERKLLDEKNIVIQAQADRIKMLEIKIEKVNVSGEKNSDESLALAEEIKTKDERLINLEKIKEELEEKIQSQEDQILSLQSDLTKLEEIAKDQESNTAKRKRLEAQLVVMKNAIIETKRQDHTRLVSELKICRFVTVTVF